MSRPGDENKHETGAEAVAEAETEAEAGAERQPEAVAAEDAAAGVQEFGEEVPTKARRPPVQDGEALPGDLPPEALALAEEDDAVGGFADRFDRSADSPLVGDPFGGIEEGSAIEAGTPALVPEGEGAPVPAEDPADPLGGERLDVVIESLLFASDKPLGLKQLGELLGDVDPARVQAAIEAIEARYVPRGMQLHGVAGGFQFRTHPLSAPWVQKLLATKPVRLSRAQLETLAICAYRQPITRPEIDEIRGVDSGGTLKTLMDRSLVRILGKKEEPGRPMLYGTTRDFLEFFNLKDLKDLPTLREFHELTEEHQAQVAALESVAPEGSIEAPLAEDEARAAQAAQRPLARVDFKPEADDTQALEEIDRLIETASKVSFDPQALSGAPAGGADPDKPDAG